MIHAGKRQLSLLGVLGAVLVVFFMLRVGGESPAETPPPPSNGTARATTSAPGGTEPAGDVKLELLQRDPAALAGAERNPFQFRPKAPPPRAAAPPSSPAEALPSLPAGPPQPPPPPPITLRFFGLTVVQGARVATFSDGRGGVFHGKEGDIIEGRYRVLRISTESVELAYLDGRGRQTIRLSGQ
jgi:hypothetical protein